MNQTSRTILWAKFHHRHARHLSAREQQSNRPSCFFQDFLGTLHSLKLKLINGFIGESKRDTMVYVIEYGGWWLFQNFPRCVYCGYASGKHRSFKPCRKPSSPQQTAPGTTWGTQKWSNPSGGGIFVYYLQWLYIYIHSKSLPVAFCRALLSHEMVVIMPTTEWMSIPDNLFFSGSILETTKKTVLISTTTIVKILLLFPNLLVVTTGQTMLACVSNTSVRAWINLGLSYHTWVEYIHMY